MINMLLALLWFDYIKYLPDTALNILLIKGFLLLLLTVLSYLVERHLSKKLRSKRLQFLDEVETKAIFSIIKDNGKLDNKKRSIEKLLDKADEEIDLKIIKRIMMLLYLDN